MTSHRDVFVWLFIGTMTSSGRDSPSTRWRVTHVTRLRSNNSCNNTMWMQMWMQMCEELLCSYRRREPSRNTRLGPLSSRLCIYTRLRPPAELCRWSESTGHLQNTTLHSVTISVHGYRQATCTFLDKNSLQMFERRLSFCLKPETFNCLPVCCDPIRTVIYIWLDWTSQNQRKYLRVAALQDRSWTVQSKNSADPFQGLTLV